MRQNESLNKEIVHLSKYSYEFEDKIQKLQQKYSIADFKAKEQEITNSYLKKKVTAMEKTVENEKLLMKSESEKLSQSKTYIQSLLFRIKALDLNLVALQDKILEWERKEILFERKCSEKNNSEHVQLEFKALEKKLEISRMEKEFLAEKYSLLQETIRNSKIANEDLLAKLESSKSIAATIYDKLLLSEQQLCKYKNAISSLCVINNKFSTNKSEMSISNCYQDEFNTDFCSDGYSSFDLDYKLDLQVDNH